MMRTLFALIIGSLFLNLVWTVFWFLQIRPALVQCSLLMQ